MNALRLLVFVVVACSPTAPVTGPGSASPPTPDELDAVTLANATWRPNGPTAIVGIRSNVDTTLIAAPVDLSPVMKLLEVKHALGGAEVLWDARRDGQAIVIAIPTGATTHRLAIVDLAAGKKRWLTRAPQMLSSPVWSHDGRSIFYGTHTTSGDEGISRVADDGTPQPRARPANTGPLAGGSSVSRHTAEGVLVGANEFNGPTAWLRELASGRELSFGARNSSVVGWRATRPRALVSVYTSIAAPGAGYVATWDDVDGQTATVWSEPSRGGDFEPGGGRIVVAAAAATGTSRLVIVGAQQRDGVAIADTDDAAWPRWTSGGIFYVVSAADHNELRVVAPTGGRSTVLLFSNGQSSPPRIVGER